MISIADFLSSPIKGVFDGFTDWHCHILPGVDDGFKTLEDSLSVLARYEEAGVKNVFFTPHVMVDMPNETDDLRRRFDELQAAYTGHLKLFLASENMLDDLFLKRLESKDFLPLPDKRLLVETSYFNPPVDLFGTLRKIEKAGYSPVLAHPERYQYMSEHKYVTLLDNEIEFQLNIASLTGYYGKEAQGRAQWLLSEEGYSYCGTDLHRKSQFEHLLESKVRRSSLKQLQETILDVSNILE